MPKHGEEKWIEKDQVWRGGMGGQAMNRPGLELKCLADDVEYKIPHFLH